MSLTGAYDPDNVFAKIIRGDMPSVKVLEDGRVLALMDVFPQSEGHVLIISKVSKARNLLEAEPDTLTDLITATQRIARAVPEALGCDGVTVSQFNGLAGGQTVFHLHFHVIPRWSDRPLSRHGDGGMADPAELEATAARIRAALTAA